MDPLTLALIFGGGTALNEMTTGQDKRKRDAILKANAYRMHAYDKSINPESYDVYAPDPMGKGIQSGIGGYSLASQMNKDKSIENFLNAKGSQAGGRGSELADVAAVSGIDEYNLDTPPNEDYFRDTHLGRGNWKDDSAYNRMNRARLYGRIS